MKKMYCMECGKQGCFFGYTYPVVFILLGIVITIFTYVICGEEAEATETWSKMNFVCSGYDNSGCRCEFVSPPNIKDNAGRFYFYCQEHYNQFPSDWIENERDVFLKIPELSEPKTHYTAEELDEIYKEEPALGKLAKSLWEDDGDETLFNLSDTGDFTLTCPNYYLEVTLAEEPNFAETDRIYLYEGDEFNVVIEKVEPNEPECEGHGVTAVYCPECHGELESLISGLNEPETVRDWVIDIGSFIPTWPDYIELEKTLVIKEPADIREIAGREHDFSFSIELSKGTKIYFKE